MTASVEGPRATRGDSDQALGADQLPLFHKLKPGPGLSADQVYADQRRRLHGAMITLVDRSGWINVRVRSLARAAGVSTSTFYKHFTDADECLASTYDAAISNALTNSSAAQRGQSDWREALRTTVTALMEDIAAEPGVAKLALVDIFAGGPEARKRIGRAVEEIEKLLATNFTLAPKTVMPPRHLVAGMAAGILRVARTTILTGRPADLPGLSIELGDWMLTLPSPEILSLPSPRLRLGNAAPRRGLDPFPAENSPERDRNDCDDRELLLRAAVKLTTRGGFANLTGPNLRTEAGVSRRRFDVCFESLDECFLDAIEMTATEAAGRARARSSGIGDWRRRTARFILALCTQAARNPAEAQIAFLGILATARTGLLRRELLVGWAAAQLRATVPPADRPSLITTEASVAAAWHIIQLDIAARRTRTLPLVAPLLTYVVLAPIIGARTAVAVQSESLDVSCLTPRALTRG